MKRLLWAVPLLLVGAAGYAQVRGGPIPNGIQSVYGPGGTDVVLADGGTSASLVASNGGIFYSTASAGAILSGTATAGLALLSGSSTTPTWGGAHVESGGQSFNSTTTLSPSGTTQTVNWALGNIQFLDMESVSGNLTVTFSGATNNQHVCLFVQTSGANPTRTLTITGAKYQSSVVPVQTATADAVDQWDCKYIGSAYYCDHGSAYGP